MTASADGAGVAGIPPLRIRALHDAPLRPDGAYVLYWMVAARRAAHSFALDRAVGIARDLGKPLVVLEALRAGYPWASDRLHAFVLEGMKDNAAAFARAGVLYHPYVEPAPGDGRGLLAALAGGACAVVTDDFPTFFVPRMLSAAAGQVRVRFEAVDGNGLLPLRAAPRVFLTAVSFRRFLQQKLAEHLGRLPSPAPLDRRPLPTAPPLPEAVVRRWPPASPALLEADPDALRRLPIDHGVPPAPLRGGTTAAREALSLFVRRRLSRYLESRNHPDDDASSGLSPWLHFGHLGVHEAFRAIADAEDWTPARLAPRATGARAGWWGMRPDAEAFLDQLVTWRELGYNMAALRDDHARFASLPPWALATLAAHARDRREHLYDRPALEAAATGDPVWNAAQRQLLAEGRIHNYMRMLWGKHVISWSRTPEEAAETLVALNDRWALDGRDPNSYSGIFWCFGRYDRPWGPERPILGKVRYMSSASALRKLRVQEYLERHGGERRQARSRSRST